MAKPDPHLLPSSADFPGTSPPSPDGQAAPLGPGTCATSRGPTFPVGQAPAQELDSLAPALLGSEDEPVDSRAVVQLLVPGARQEQVVLPRLRQEPTEASPQGAPCVSGPGSPVASAPASPWGTPGMVWPHPGQQEGHGGLPGGGGGAPGGLGGTPRGAPGSQGWAPARGLTSVCALASPALALSSTSPKGTSTSAFMGP